MSSIRHARCLHVLGWSPGPLAPIFPAYAARYAMPSSVRCSAAGPKNFRSVAPEGMEYHNIWKGSRYLERGKSIAVYDVLPSSFHRRMNFAMRSLPSPRNSDGNSTQDIIRGPSFAAVNAFYWASINSHAPTKQARILQAGRVLGYGIGSAALPDTHPTRWHRYHCLLAAAWRPEAKFAKALMHVLHHVCHVQCL
jgi:hypothetical protein